MADHHLSPDPRGVPLWARTASTHPPLPGDVGADACVVGLGASGLACARELRRLGLHVVALDAGSVGAGAAGRNGGFLLAGLAPFYHDLVDAVGRERSRAMYTATLEEIARTASDPCAGFAHTGSLRIAESEDEREDCERQLAAMRMDGLSVERYDGPEGVGLLLPTDGVFHPLARCHSLAETAAAEGVVLHERTRVHAVESGAVHASGGTVRAPIVVVAVDGALDRLVPALEARVRTARLQMLATAPTREIALPRPVYARWGYDYWQQRPDGAIALGGARDIGGESEWTHDAEPSAPVQAALEHRLRERLGVRAPVTHRWAALVGYTDDGLPIAEEVQRGVWAIGGYSGTGNVVGTLLGRAVAQRAVTGDATLLAPFAGNA